MYNPSEELKHSIEDLRLFVEQNIDSGVPHLYRLDVQDGHLVPEKGIRLRQCLFGMLFSRRIRQDQKKKRDRICQVLLQAVATVSSHYPLIEKLERGNPDEQCFAEKALEVIRRYNAVIGKASAISLTDYLYKCCGLTVDEELKRASIVLPQMALFESSSSLASKKVRQESLSKSSVSQKFSTFEPSQHEVDAFRMKAITLINKHEIPASIQEAVSSLKDSPIVVKHEESERSEASRQAIISFQQILTPFPGEVIKLTGCFKRNPQTALLSIPIPESFQVASQSTQTAFPHPLQHNGWALADVLIPNYPLRPDQLPLFNRLAEKKRKVAYALLPKGHLRTKAKQLIEAKKAAFDHHRAIFLGLHRKVARAVLCAADEDTACDNIIEPFYRYVEKQASSYECLAGVYQAIEERYLSSLYRRLYDEWLEVGNDGLRGGDDQKKSLCAMEVMKQELALRLDEALEPEVADYVRLMGHVLGKASNKIIVQSMSEKIGMAPPMLTEFEQKVQRCALLQVMSFLDEVETTPAGEVITRMKDSLDYEVALFQEDSIGKDVAADMVNELEVYYNSRFYASRRSAS